MRGTGSSRPGGGSRLGLLRSVLENANDAVLVTEGVPIDEPGPRIIYANAAFSRTTGYSYDEIVGETPRMLQGPETDRQRLDEVRAALEAGEAVRTEILNYRKDGSTFWVELDVVPVFGEDDGGWPEMWVSVQRETTTRVHAEQEKLEAEGRLRAVLARYGSDMITILESDGTPRYESPAVERALGYKHKELAEGEVFRFVHPDDIEELGRSVTEALSTPGESPPTEFRMKHADGSWRWFESAKNNLSDDPDVNGIVVVTRDVTARKEAEQALEESEKLLRAVADGAPVITFALDAEGVFTFENGRVQSTPGLGPVGNVGRSVFEVCADRPEIIGYVQRAFSGEEVVATVEIGGRSYQVTYSPQHGGDGVRVEGVIGVATDITERRRLEKELEHRAFHDGLTGLPNRDLLADRLGHALSRMERRGGSVAVLFMDLDNFKYVNDSLGHGAGDALLVEVAERVRSVLRPEDTVSRMGGDEFCVLLDEVTGEAEAADVAERILRVLKPAVVLGDEEVFVTASVGVALGRPGEATPEDLLGDADTAMYKAKEGGRNGYEVFRPEMRAAPARRLRLEGDLRRALERGELTVFYQPQVLIETGEVFGTEALVRWEHPERGLLRPSEFVPLAEETGLIIPIDRWVLGEACRQAKEWRRARPGGMPTMSVNLSARQFRDPGLVRVVRDAIEENGIEPGVLVLEITEGVLMQDAPSTVAALEGLRSLGVRIAIDDFGTGYSSLSYLRRFTVDYLKIDRSIVSGVERDPANGAIVAATVALGRAMDLRVVAEGVETVEEAGKLKSLGCELGQGFYWYRPAPPREFAELMGKERGTA